MRVVVDTNVFVSAAFNELITVENQCVIEQPVFY